MRRYSYQTEILKSIKGFTLMEVMTVAAIIGLLSAIAVPNYLQWQSRYQLKQAAMEITSQLTTSRFVAMTRNVPVTTTFSISGGQLLTIATNATDATAPPVFLQASTLPKVTAVAVQGGGILQFSSSGLRASGAIGSDQLIQVTNDRGQIYSVRLTQGGKASWCPKNTCP
jgi:prepilin-type N-terminal cleavage/methylation domain-containing protein